MELLEKIKEKSAPWFYDIKKYETIMIFGAKDRAHDTHTWINNANGAVDCFIVSKRADNPMQLDGLPVKVFDEISEEEKNRGLVVVSQIYESDGRMREILRREGFKNIISSPLQSTGKLTDEMLGYASSLLGHVKFAKDLQTHGNAEKNICIYAVTSRGNMHKNAKLHPSKYVKYIMAGGGIDEMGLASFYDNTGDNISELNPYYCELTAGYWIYKNDRTNDYVGLYHYSRGLGVTDGQIESVVSADMDILVPTPGLFRYGMVSMVALNVFEGALEVIRDICPEYLPSAEQYLSERLMFCGNILFAKKEVFCRYYEWMFSILFETEKRMKEKWDNPYPRCWGYAGEHLTGMFLLKHAREYKIAYADMKVMH